MGREISSLAVPFRKVLLSFADGDISFADAQSDLLRLLAAGALPDDLREVMRRCESMEPLPVYAREELLRMLNAVTASATPPTPHTPPAPAAGAAPDTRPRPRAVEPVAAPPIPPQPTPPQPTPVDLSKSLERRIARQKVDYQELTHTYERARDAGSAAAARAIAVSADLSAVRGALEAEQNKNRDSALALADAAAAYEAARAALAARDGLLAAQDATLAVRDATIEDLRHELRELRELRERDAQGSAQFESALAAERAQSAALEAQVAQIKAALEAEQNLNRDGERALAEAATVHKASSAALAAQDATVAALREQLAQAQAQLNALNETLVSRDQALGQLRGELEQRERLLASRQQEHAQVVAGLEARLQALATDLASARAAVDLEQRKAQEALAEQAATAQTLRGQGEAARREHALIVAALERRANALDSELQGTKSRIEAAATASAVAASAVAAPAVAVPAVAAPAVAPASVAAPAVVSPPPERPSVQREPKREPDSEPLLARPAAPTAALRWPASTLARAAGVGGALLLLVLLVWSFGHRASAPATAPAAAVVADPAPGTVLHDCPTCPALTVVPAGRFKQGSLRGDSVSAVFERPLHWVLINHAFGMSTNAVSVDEFRAFVAATGRDMRGCDVYDEKWHVRPDASWESPGFPQTGAHPVTCVSWEDATAYASWLSKSTGHHYRLPSASEWEYAARAGSEAVQPWNSDGVGACTVANVADQHAAKKYPGWAVFACDDGYVYTAPGGSFKANAFGLNDMLGNVFQWTGDCWYADYTGAPSDGSARTSGDCGERELRGGSWFTTPNFVRSTYRNHFGVNYRSSTQGIRLVRDLTP